MLEAFGSRRRATSASAFGAERRTAPLRSQRRRAQQAPRIAPLRLRTRSRHEGERAFSPGVPARRVERADGALAPRQCDAFVPTEAGEPRDDVRQDANELVRARIF